MPAGRQREFDEEIALEAAMSAFWANGFSGTSMADLTRAMGINKPSLYAAFGNKEALFVRALTHYLGKHGYPHAEKLQAKDRSLPERLPADIACRRPPRRRSPESTATRAPFSSRFSARKRQRATWLPRMPSRSAPIT